MDPIQCSECGELFEPLSDCCVCPVCGAENYPEYELGGEG